LKLFSVTKDPYTLAFLLNANYADGIDTSWIWDANFEDFDYDKLPLVITGGKRVKDVTYRFKIAGLDMKKISKQLRSTTSLNKLLTSLLIRFTC
jgi:UDP-N-acetylmuramyl tripeptide synthase